MQWRAAGRPCPMLDRRPELLPESEPYWNGFSSVTRKREFQVVGNQLIWLGISNIEFESWMRMNGIDDPEDVADYFEVFDTMDKFWLGKKAEKQTA